MTKEHVLNLIEDDDNFFLPEKLMLFGEPWKVIVLPELPNKNHLGLCNYNDRTILLKNYERMFSTIIHELIHAKDHYFGNFDRPESEVRLETVFWLSVFKQLKPLARLWKEWEKEGAAEDNKKDNQISKLKAENKKLKLKIKSLQEKLKNVGQK